MFDCSYLFYIYLDLFKFVSWYSILNICFFIVIIILGSIFFCFKLKFCLEVGVIGYKCKKLVIIKVIVFMNRYTYIYV